MMGSSHALSGAALWAGGSTLAALAGLRPDLPTLVIGGIVCAGAALLPDIDCPGDMGDPRGGSHAARAFGPLSRGVALGVNRFSRWVQRRTRAPGEPAANGGHRWLTHTAAFAAVLGAVVSVLAVTPWGGWTAGTVLFVCGTLAARSLLPWQLRSWRPRPWRLDGLKIPMSPVYGGLLAGGAYVLVGEAASWVWLGPAVAAGCMIHDLGDMVTDGGTPFLWPVPVAGWRWRRLAMPLFATNSTGETVAGALLGALLIGSLYGMSLIG